MDRSRGTNQDLSRDSRKGKLLLFSLRNRSGETSEGTQDIEETKKELSDAIESVCKNIRCIKEYIPQDMPEYNLGRFDHHMKKIKKYEGMLEQKDVNEQEYRQKISHCKSLIAKYYLPDEFSQELIKSVEDFNINLSRINNKMKSLGKMQEYCQKIPEHVIDPEIFFKRDSDILLQVEVYLSYRAITEESVLNNLNIIKTEISKW